MSERTRSPGAILRAEREALGVTVREVSETLNLSLNVIDALETDDLSRLPGPVFARGYLRAYARLLDLDPEPLLVGYARAPVAPDPRHPPEGESASPRDPGIPDLRAVREWLRAHPQPALAGAGLAVLLVLVLLVVWLWPAESADAPGVADPAAPAEPATDAYRDLPRSGPEPGAEAVDDLPPDGGAPGGTPPDAAAAPLAAETGAGGAEAPPGVATSAEVVTGTPVRRITEEGEDRLQLTVSADCWVEVKGPDGRVLYSDISRGGSNLELIGGGPFRVLLGYAPGVELSFNGESIPLGPHTRNNVASLSLGQ